MALTTAHPVPCDLCGIKPTCCASGSQHLSSQVLSCGAILAGACAMSAALKPGLARRGRTLYLPWTKAPMFPVVLAEDVFSLARPDACPTLTFTAVVSAEGEVLQHEVAMGMTRARRITYDDSDEVIAGRPGSDTAQALGDDAAGILRVRAARCAQQA